MIEKLKQWRELLSELNEFQMADERFFEMFSDYETARRPDDEFPFEAFVVIDGIKIFTILSQEEYEKYVLKEVV